MMLPVRKNYDKPNRCPGWSGSGIREYGWETKQNSTVECNSSSSGYYADVSRIDKYANFNFHQCEDCGTITLPIILQYVDPEYWYSIHGMRLKWAIRRHLRYAKKNITKRFNSN